MCHNKSMCPKCGEYKRKTYNFPKHFVADDCQACAVTFVDRVLIKNARDFDRLTEQMLMNWSI